jgi:hypothetical protein
MGIFAAILGGIGGLCAILGIITILDVITLDLRVDLTWDFWLIISAVLLLASIAISVGYKREPVE